jgi:hypothetical protein
LVKVFITRAIVITFGDGVGWLPVGDTNGLAGGVPAHPAIKMIKNSAQNNENIFKTYFLFRFAKPPAINHHKL